MKNTDISWKLFTMYLLIIFLMLFSNASYGQIVVTHFNADWNDPKKHNIIIVPTVVIFKDGEEMKRFQANISFSMKATRKEMQAVIDELIMSDF
jgi:hypothetical protein